MSSSTIVDNSNSIKNFSFFYNEEGPPVCPYVVGVTGHRDLIVSEEKVIKAAFKKQLEILAVQWREKCGGTAPLVLISGMAEGADQIAVEAALELDAELNIKIIAVLPMEREEYLTTMSSDEGKNRFKELINNKNIISILLPKEESQQEEIKSNELTQEEVHEKQYEALARYISFHGHVLFAFWNGTDLENNNAGTSAVVRFKLYGSGLFRRVADDPLTFPTIGPVVHLRFPRANETTNFSPGVFLWTRERLKEAESSQKSLPEFPTFVEKDEYQLGENSEDLIALTTPVMERLGEFNQTVVKYQDIHQFKMDNLNNPKEYQKLYGDLFPDLSKESPEAKATTINEILNEDSGTRILAENYRISSCMADYYKKWRGRWRWCYVLMASMYLIFSGLLVAGTLISQYIEHTPNITVPNWCSFWVSDNGLYSLLTACYVIAIPLVLLYWYWRKKFPYQREWCRWRSVAEALRVQLFWRIAGIKGCVSSFYRYHQTQSIDWLRMAVYGLVFLLPPPKSESVNRDVVWENWVNGQFNWFQDKLGRLTKHKQSSGFSEYVPTIFFLIYPAALMNLSENMVSLAYNLSNFNIGTAFVLVVSFFLILITGRLFWLVIDDEFNPISEIDLLQRIQAPFQRALWLNHKNRESGNILYELGKEALTHNAEWLRSVEDKKLTLPG